MTTLDDLSLDQLQALYAQKTDPHVAAIHSIETGGASPTANPVNPASGASGSMQTMAATAARPGYGVKPSDGTPIDNTRTGVQYYQSLRDKYQDPVKAAVAYDWGPGNADKWIANGSKLDDLPLETLQYIQKFDHKTGALTKTAQEAPQPAPAPAATTAPEAPTQPAAAAPAQQPAPSLTDQFIRQLGLTGRAVGHGIGDAAGALTQGFTRAMGVPDERKLINDFVDAHTPAPQGGIENAVQAVGSQVANPVNYLAPAGGIARTAIGGAAAAGMQPTDQGASPVDTIKGMFAGGVTGGALGALGRALAPQTSTAVQRLRAAGVEPTPGQMGGKLADTVEAQSTSVPFTGQLVADARGRANDSFNKALYGRALADVPNTVMPDAVGRQGVLSLKNQLGASYDDVLGKMSFAPDQQFVADMAPAAQLANELPRDLHDRFAQILDDTLMNRLPAQGPMNGQALQDVKSDLTRQIKEYGGPTATVDERKISQALRSTLVALRTGLQRQNPAQAPTLAAIDKGYSVYALLREASGMMKDPEQAISPLAFQRAVKLADMSQGKGAYATGTAPMSQMADDAVQIMGRRTPDSGTAGRMNLGMLLGGGAAATGTLPALATSMGMQALYASRPGQAVGRAILADRPGLVRQAGQALPGTVGILGGLSGAAGAQTQRGQDSTR